MSADAATAARALNLRLKMGAERDRVSHQNVTMLEAEIRMLRQRVCILEALLDAEVSAR